MKKYNIFKELILFSFLLLVDRIHSLESDNNKEIISNYSESKVGGNDQSLKDYYTKLSEIERNIFFNEGKLEEISKFRLFFMQSIHPHNKSTSNPAQVKLWKWKYLFIYFYLIKRKVFIMKSHF